MRIAIRMSIEHAIDSRMEQQVLDRGGNRFSRKTSINGAIGPTQWRNHASSGVGQADRLVLHGASKHQHQPAREHRSDCRGQVRNDSVSFRQTRSRRPASRYSGWKISMIESMPVAAVPRAITAVIAIRDSAYLNWRFNSRPDASYVCLAAAEESRHPRIPRLSDGGARRRAMGLYRGLPYRG